MGVTPNAKSTTTGVIAYTLATPRIDPDRRQGP